jgi:hypothetical protein
MRERTPLATGLMAHAPAALRDKGLKVLVVKPSRFPTSANLVGFWSVSRSKMRLPLQAPKTSIGFQRLQSPVMPSFPWLTRHSAPPAHCGGQTNQPSHHLSFSASRQMQGFIHRAADMDEHVLLAVLVIVCLKGDEAGRCSFRSRLLNVFPGSNSSC